MPNYRYQQGDQPLEGYTIQYALGRGGFGEVYFGVSDSGREVALKAVQNYEDVELRGISHCMNLKSPHLVTIFDVRRGQGGVPWVIMEYVSGPSLHEVLNEADSEGIGEDQAMFFTRELIKGLRYLHDAGVVHRDLKPHNIFFEDGTVKIGDYSLSKAISGTQQTGHTTTVGSVHYMAPEIGEGKYDKSVDIYAVGVILFEMLTGGPPYVGESMAEVLIKHLTSEPDVSQLSQPFADVIQTAMKRDPAERFASVDEMLLALCPTDHSSYLAPPTSLTMIGERAAKKRTDQNMASLAGRAQRVGGSGISMTDTFLPTAELVDTKENKISAASSLYEGLLGFSGRMKKAWNESNGFSWLTEFFSLIYEGLLGFSDRMRKAWNESNGFSWLTDFFSSSHSNVNSDSVPFSRPGFSFPLTSPPSWFSIPGLLWRPTGNQLAKTDAAPLAWRVVVALVISSALIGLSTLSGPTGQGELPLLLPPLIVSLAAGLTWAMRQFLPHSQALAWTIVSRIVAAFLVWLAGMAFALVWMEFTNERDPSFLREPVVFFILSMVVIDWRCFISADRYPRVGMIRTATVAAFFVVPFMFDGPGRDSSFMALILPSLSVVATAISIQLLAPQHRALTTQIATKKAKSNPETNNASFDPAISNTRADESEIDAVKEIV